eukprot:CAMPEP_0177716624 /NCGR_PEP_ID=MMETSP0484_2-20121128/14605_1 /TAXON_ID=354590 /ORGANISM="Rhodomonas lens, Strain RHODO" /LENGTH=121 /DNA_ID=CAMNT_0019228659 /DNA_START=90 /DNA_END=455 /DNA_ORIENTATION=+
MLSLRFSSAVALLLLSLASAQAFCSTSLLQPSLRLRNECSATPMHMAAERRGDGLNLNRREFATVALSSILVALPSRSFAAEEAQSTKSTSSSSSTSSEGGVKECDTPPKPKGEEVCEVDY